MAITSPHRWDVSPEEAVAIQNRLRSQLDLQSEPREIRTVAGIDVSYDKGSDVLFAAIVVLQLPHLQELDTVGTSAVVPFPYVPGLLSFRECPAVLRAWEKLRVIPDCIMCDGQGIAHPRRFGIASHLGVWLDIPAIGCAKSLLVGTYEEPGVKRGSFLPLVHRKEQVGVILRTKDNTGPVFVSQGNKISLRQAIEIVLACGTKYRIPEPTRQAHLVVNALRRQANTPSARDA